MIFARRNMFQNWMIWRQRKTIINFGILTKLSHQKSQLQLESRVIMWSICCMKFQTGTHYFIELMHGNERNWRYLLNIFKGLNLPGTGKDICRGTNLIHVIILTPERIFRMHVIEESDFLYNLLLHVGLISSLLKLSL